MPVTSNARRGRYRRLGYLLGSAMLVAGIGAGSIAAGGMAQAAAVHRPFGACPVTYNAATALFSDGQPVGGTELRASAGCNNLAVSFVASTATYRGWVRAASGGRWAACSGSFVLTAGAVRPPVTLCRGVVSGALLKVVGPPAIHVRYDADQAGIRLPSACQLTVNAATALADGAGGTELRESAGCSTLTITAVAETAYFRGLVHNGRGWVACGPWFHLGAGSGRRVVCGGIGAGALLRVQGSLPRHIRYNAEH